MKIFKKSLITVKKKKEEGRDPKQLKNRKKIIINHKISKTLDSHSRGKE
jgi:hypothetical protein